MLDDTQKSSLDGICSTFVLDLEPDLVGRHFLLHVRLCDGAMGFWPALELNGSLLACHLRLSVCIIDKHQIKIGAGHAHGRAAWRRKLRLHRFLRRNWEFSDKGRIPGVWFSAA